MDKNSKTIWRFIYEGLQKYAETLNLNLKFNLEEPKNLINGFYATNFAMVAAKWLKKSPLVIAEEVIIFLKTHLQNFKHVTATVAKPGFINFTFSDELIWNVCKKVLQEKQDYGRGRTKNYKYNLEIVSANPTGLLHIGHARNGAIGDSVARILKFRGYDVVVEHYTNDAGNQINICALTIFISYLKLCGVDKELPQDCYQGDFYVPPAQLIFDKYGDKFKDVKYSDVLILDPAVNDIFKKTGVDYFLAKNKAHIELINVHIDNYISEKSMYETGKIDESLKTFASKKVSYFADGALWLATSKMHDDKDRVIIKSDGTYTYLLPDVTSHWDKISRTHANKLIDFWGGDHHDYIKRMQIGLGFLGSSNDILEVDVISMVRIIKNGAEYKMSKRAGTAVWLIDLYNRLGSDVIRYMLACKPGSSPMDLDITLLEDQTQKNPIFYIQYAASRCASIIDHFGSGAVLPSVTDLPSTQGLVFEERVLLNKIDSFERTVRLSGEYRMPHMMCDYIFDLAKKFHIYYNKYKVINSGDKEITEQRLSIIRAVAQVLQTALKLIGIKSKTRM